MVIFRTPDGMPGYQQSDGPGDVVATVERLRNEDGVENIRVYRLDEVEFEYKVHYTVQLKDPSLSAAGSTPEPAPVASEALSWDDDEAGDEPTGGSEGEASAPFDQMAAVDTGAAPPWGREGDAGEAETDATDARRGLFGR